jgi:tetratricopeptide (TPR) repeat protein
MTDRVERKRNLCRRCTLQRLSIALFTILLLACGSKAVQDAQTFLDVKEYGRAKDLLELELKTNPKNEDAYLLLGKTNLLLEDEDAASKAFDTALLLDKDNKERIGATYAAAGQALYEGIPGGEEVQTERITKALSYLSRALTYDPDAKASIKQWALRTAGDQASTTRTTHPLLLLGGITSLDPSFRRGRMMNRMPTATAYAERNFMEEAAIYARSAGSWDPSHLKPAAKLLRAAGLVSQDADYLRLAIKWDPTLDDEPVAWALTQAGALPHAEYLRRYPKGAHVAQARTLIVRGASDDGLLAYFPMDGNPWKFAANVANEPGVRGDATVLHDGWILLGPDLTVLPGDFTISLFVKSTDRGQLIAKATANRHVLGIGHTDAQTPQGVAFTFNGGEVNVYSTTDVLDGQWHHLAAVTRGRTAELWVDGEHQRSQPIPEYPSDPGRFGIGRLGEIEDTFTGAFDELKLWRRALDPAEIRSEAHVQRTPSDAAQVPAQTDTTATTTSGSFSDGSRTPEQVVGVLPVSLDALDRGITAAGSRSLRAEELSALNRMELSVLRNSIYARHGQRFKSAMLQSYFSSEPWYRENPNYHEGLLTPADRQNLATIATAERSR